VASLLVNGGPQVGGKVLSAGDDPAPTALKTESTSAVVSLTQGRLNDQLTGGRDDLAMIAYYAPRLRHMSTDGQRLTGTAYGARLFRSGPGGASQFERVIALLRADPDTKRAVMVIMDPGELIDSANPDVACTLALHLMVRGGALHMAASMRANDALTGLLCHVFSFTFIQEHAARLLGVPVGSYTHHAGSMHVNVADLPKARTIHRA
jgi:thymidylate synthase